MQVKQETINKEDLLKRKVSIEATLKQWQVNIAATNGALQLTNLLLKEIEQKEVAKEKLEIAKRIEEAKVRETKPESKPVNGKKAKADAKVVKVDFTPNVKAPVSPNGKENK